MLIDVKNVKIEIYTPEEYVEALRNALNEIGACHVGAYDHVISWQDTKGNWRPLPESTPFNGEKGEICFGHEVKAEVLCPIELLDEADAVIRRVHPYEEPVINRIPLI